MLCERVSNVEWTLYSINAGFEPKPIFDLSPSIKEVIQVPLWAPDEPQDYMSFSQDYYKVVNKKEHTTPMIIKERFVPIFERFIQAVYHGTQDMRMLDVVFYDMWKYFQKFDYKETMQDYAVWEAFKKEATQETEADGSFTATLFDITVGLRWLYRFLIPFSNPIFYSNSQGRPLPYYSFWLSANPSIGFKVQVRNTVNDYGTRCLCARTLIIY